MASIADVMGEAQRHLGAGRLDRAERLLRQVLETSPKHFEALCLLGFSLKQRAVLGEAERCYARALEVRPESAPAWFAHGEVLRQLERNDAAVDSFNRTLALDAHHVGACLELGNLLFPREPNAGLGFLRRAFEIDPNHDGVRACLTLGHVAMGALHAAREDWAEMLAAYRRALDIDPSHAEAHFNLAVELLRTGEYAQGWREYEWRWQWAGFADRPRNFPQPLWRGEPLNGARILLHAEQGLGDAIQFVRYLPLVAERGGTVVLEVYEPLVRLLASLPGVATMVSRGSALPVVDWHCPLMSLPLAFDTTLETVPAPVPYVTAAAAPLEPDGPISATGARRIGLAWAGSPTHLRDQRRSIGLDLFAPLTHVQGTRWYSLQKGPAALALAASPAADLVDLGPRMSDFFDTAALIASLDLVITVDTSVAHLAGAMGKPVWILLSAPSDWRWMLGRDDSPWYPTARLFRQAVPGQWGPVLEQIHQALRAMTRPGHKAES
jgi:cytochrome c-type biogenesis protein CcmH/NrfG